jgi:hypothetical protein
MKKGFLILILLISYSYYGFENNDPSIPKGIYTVTIDGNQYQVIPDVMNRINVAQFDGHIFKNVTMNADSFPNFTGFPAHLQYYSSEGGAVFCNMDSDPDLEIVIDMGHTVYAMKKDGSNVPGWPKSVSGYFSCYFR